MLKADLHIHTQYSMDCDISLDRLIERCLELEINCIAVADHGTAEGGLALKQKAPFTVIVAEEILTPEGEIMGMFLKETIPSGISVEEAINSIKEQNGLVCIPHPFDRLRPSAIKVDTFKKIAHKVDIIEAFNARTILFKNRNRTRAFAEEYNLKQSAGSDAHTLAEVGNAYVDMPSFNGREDFLDALAKGKICGKSTNPLTHFSSLKNRIKKRHG
ncbi:PHP domain-containing protein [Chloroflexota bacterium]